MRTTLAFLAILCVAPIARAQQNELPRRAHPGRVLDATGKPIADAVVTFVSGTDGFGIQQDVATATTRSNGRFRIDLLPTRRYRVWAIAPAGTLLEGAQVASNITDRAVPMTEIRFPEKSNAKPVATGFVIKKLEAWREHGEVRVDVRFAGCRDLVESVVVGEDGRVPLPPLPNGSRAAHIFVAGNFVHTMTNSGDMTMPAPHVVRGRVVDSDDKPVNGARIERIMHDWRHQRAPFPQRTRVMRFEVASTDAHGKAQWLVAADKDPFEPGQNHWPPMAFVARANAFSECVAGFTEAIVSDDHLVTDAVEDRTLPFALQAHATVRAEVVPAARATRLSWLGSHTLPRGPNGGATTTFDARRGEPIVNGVTSLIPWSKQTREPRLYLHDVMPPLADDDPFRKAATPWPLELVGQTTNEAFRINLADVIALRVQLLDSHGGPATSAHIACVSLENGVSQPFAWPVTPDSAGRFVLPVLAGRYILVAVQGKDCVIHEVAVTQGQPALSLRLAPLPRALFRVVDSTNKPVAGATIRSQGASWGGGGDPVQSVLQEFGHVYAGWAMSQCKSDAQGHLEVPVFEVQGLRVNYRIHSGKRRSARSHLVSADDRLDVTVRD